MNNSPLIAALLLALHLSLQIALIVRALLRPHRDPASRIAWVVVMAALPLVGIVAYVLLGEVNLGRRRIERMRATLARLPNLTTAPGMARAIVLAQPPERMAHLFSVGQSISGFAPVGGNRASLLPDSDAAIEAIVADIDAARDTVHLIFYIWLPDGNGGKVVAALKRAAARGVICRAMADDLGSKLMIRSPHWESMRHAGIRLARALPIGNPLLRPMKGRIDLRNHRKIVVIDNRITYCGSQNCADPAFRVKPKYAPWVDAMMRFEGPVARQNQFLFAADWMSHVDEDLGELLLRSVDAPEIGFAAQVIGTGPTVRYAAMPELFETLMFSARRELVITTPYYVPDESIQAALCASARRGVSTTIVFPARNDSWVVGAASRSYYADLLDAGVKIYEYLGGLLHTKSLTLDGEVTLIGSANMDRRSFDLNYENNILLHDPVLTAAMRQRQDSYIAKARAVTPASVAGWTRHRRLWNNTIAMLGPVL
ncbi:cardiolipin synthase [Thiocystis violascens]|uniref:Cardiolipin synthase n=1 Tax=Thiocystis violascens (strain ATCC 17096 / DSM 198 / 6111) TaxID=765911 RepID=I3YB01_THIV6|nr:cardiolipin synthase [Thiocystis violascens]AFL74169.1 phosphatidylserine/phosphatidylglycerophosphate/cardiolipin synthase [Thiocystis violascens DSM 198]